MSDFTPYLLHVRRRWKRQEKPEKPRQVRREMGQGVFIFPNQPEREYTLRIQPRIKR